MVDYEELIFEMEARAIARRLSITVDYTLFFETAPNHSLGRPQVVIPRND